MRMSFSDEAPARRLAVNGLLLGLCLIFSYLEAVLPLPAIPIPGCKPGFANVVITFATLTRGIPTAVLVSLARVLISALLFGNPAGFLYSASGAVAALTLLCLLHRLYPRSLSPIGLSVAAAAAHNVGQLLCARLVTGTNAVLAYFPALLITGALMGSITGVLLCLLIPYIPSTLSKGDVR